MAIGIREKLNGIALLMLISIGSGASASTINASEEIHIGSNAALWGARSFESKTNYLDGLCDGMSTNSQFKLADLRCSENSISRPKYRFCGIQAGNAQQAVQILDDFYKKGEHSDLEAWVAVASFNDQMCGENLVTSRMSKMQALRKCNRRAANMLSDGVSLEAQKKQQDYCNSLAR